MIDEMEEWLRLRVVSGRYSAGLLRELSGHYENRTLHVHMILDEIAALEGVRGSKPSITKPATMFRGPVLAGLWHKHFMQPGYIAQNLIAALQAEGFVRKTPDPNDGRQTILALTKGCRYQIARARVARADWLQRAIGSELSPVEQRHLARGLALLNRVLDR
jgi:hypothetical protein